ncbi:hypothetical protein TcasGA2_TC008571 [Tribolium castaneum]|uniref:Endonuclease/exonuclease/phosphatase domain-containing protein n=1 Tax=Tribolium castaneum TaxID=7070 RepID=D7EIB7_TRICA|nr:hypothetical protein TcasGA2_TC008571 [Tribolium castaneum]
MREKTLLTGDFNAKSHGTEDRRGSSLADLLTELNLVGGRPVRRTDDTSKGPYRWNAARSEEPIGERKYRRPGEGYSGRPKKKILLEKGPLIDWQRTRGEFWKVVLKTKAILWEMLIEDINRNPWGTAFRIVTSKAQPSTPLTRGVIRRAVRKLFPERPVTNWVRPRVEAVENFTVQEL